MRRVSVAELGTRLKMANEIEDIIRARIIEERYDDVIRVVAPDASKEARVMEEAERATAAAAWVKNL